MKLGKLLWICALSVYIPLAAASGPSPAGTWNTMDDKTGEKRAVIRIDENGNTLTGTIIKTYPRPGDTGICHNCTGKFKDKKILGLVFMWGLKDEGQGIWSGGTILDPNNGKMYRAKVTLAGNKLYVRGYLGVSVLGRTQTWVR